MNYGQVKNESLKLINAYSIAGSTIAPSYNNQADYEARVPGLVDAAESYIATTAKKITERVDFSTLTKIEKGKSYIVTLPTNCWQMAGAGLLLFTDDDETPFVRYHQYKNIDGGFVIDKAFADKHADNLMLEYYRFPVPLGDSPAADTELDNTAEVHQIIPYYVASHLIMHDDFALYTTLNNEFETKLLRLGEVAQTETSRIRDVYGTSDWGDYCGY